MVPIASLTCPSATPGCSTTFASGTSQSALLLNHQYSFDETVAASSGRHEVKFGGGMVHAHNGSNSKEFGGPIPLGQFRHKTYTQAPAVCETTYLNNINNVQSYTQSYCSASYTVDDELLALFVQQVA